VATDVLLIDDLGDEVTRDDNPWMAAALKEVLDLRIGHGRPVVVSSNLDLAQLRAHYGAQHGGKIADRLAGHCEVRYLSGPSLRFQVGG
jgi:DNA replication protein DnaC